MKIGSEGRRDEANVGQRPEVLYTDSVVKSQYLC